MRTLLSAACAVLLLAVAGPASSAPVPPGGFALVELTSTSALTGMNIALTTEAPAQTGTLFGDTYAQFPVVDVTGNITSIGLSGGLRFTRSATQLSWSDFVINLGQNRVFAEVNNAGGSVFPVFNLVPCQTVGTCPVGPASSILTGIGLNLTTEARTALNAAFTGANVPANFQVGILKQVTLIPEPAAGSLLLVGLVALGLRGRRRAI